MTAALLGSLATAGLLGAQEVSHAATAARSPPVVRGCCTDGATRPALEATRLEGGVELDGRMDEADWRRAAVATGFTQFSPDEGAPASERTEARVLYGEDALYVFLRAFDSRPDSIVGQVTRRDQMSYSDALGVVVDSYFDRRTAFHFAVNPEGVQYDIYRYDDTAMDFGWDAVWEVATRRDPDGWSAEFRIPYSQLRFGEGGARTWGINFVRDIARRDETVMWSPTVQDDNAMVSLFGELQGLEGVEAPTRLEVLPYSVARVEQVPGNPANPFWSESRTTGAVGADLKLGLTGNLTLDLTLNPDFGQVEADPAQVNLSAFETFLPERRPFFQEGASIFNFGIGLGDGDGSTESLFYSRRIGRPPQGSVEEDGWVDADDRTTILGAWKISGKTSDGWSVGLLHAITGQEEAVVAPDAGAASDRLTQAVEPETHYGVIRLQKDFREGRSALGIIGTGTRRDGEVADALGLHRHAFAGGLDARHRFGDDNYELTGYILGSRVDGSAETLRETQERPAHYFQRPDADHLDYDPTRTSLSGTSGFLSIGKIAGGHWRFSTGLQTRSGGFDVNDLGYQRDADSFVNWAWIAYRQNSTQGIFRNYGINLNGWQAYTTAWDRTGLGGNVNANAQFTNYWHAYAGINRDLASYSGRTLRGGPLFRTEAQTNAWAGFGTDSRKALRFNLNGWGNVRGESDSRTLGLSPSLRWRASGRAQFNLGLNLRRTVEDRQWVDRVGEEDPAYLFGRLDQTTVGVTLRADYAFSPTLSFQLYAQPFVSAGEYGGYKVVTDPVAEAYADRFRPVETRRDGDDLVADVDGDGALDRIGRPDFNVKQFRSNAVLRWQYLPGSTLYLVWSQGRDHDHDKGAFDFGTDLDTLFGVESEDVFMIKVSYWFGG